MDTDPESRQRLEELLLHALDLDNEGQSTLLRKLQDEEPELAEDLRRALAAEDDTAFLAPPEVPTRSETGALPLLGGQRVGSSRLVQPIGEGGMGIVYQAVQPELGRRVAVKLMKGSVSEEARQRFDYEVRLLAQFKHPGIAQVLESGTLEESAGRVPWFTMEYIEEGRPLDAWAHEKELDQRGRIELFLDLCDAIVYAHQRGVIHRDLKPANVLVDKTGQVKVIDFGVARGLDDGAGTRPFETMEGRAVGTLRYMSPEQAAGENDLVDVRSDVWALGVILYKLLCDRHPLIETGEDLGTYGLMRAIMEREPLRPSRAAPGIGANLDAILLCCLRNERERRYESVASLAHDLRCHLAGAPVAARVPSPGERFAYWVRKNRAIAVGSALAVLALVAGAVVSIVFALQAETARAKQAELARQAEDARAAEAERAAVAEARLEASREFAWWVTEDLQNRLARLPGALEIREALVRRVIEHLDSMGEDETDPELRYTVIAGYITASAIQGAPTTQSLGDAASAEKTLAKAEALATAFLADHPNNLRALTITSQARNLQADLLTVEGRLGEARRRYESVLELLTGLLAEVETDRGVLEGRRRAHRGLAIVAAMTQDVEAMVEHGRQASATARAEYRTDPDKLSLAELAIASSLSTTRDLIQARQFDAAEDEMAEAEDVLESFEEDDVRMSRARGDYFRTRGTLHEARGELGPAARSYRSAGRLLRKAMKDHPDDVPLAHEYSSALIGAGNVSWKRSEGEAAADLYRENIKLRRRMVASTGGTVEQRRHLAFGLTRLLLLSLSMGNVDTASEIHREADVLIGKLLASGDESILPLAMDVKKARGQILRLRSEAPELSEEESLALRKEALDAWRQALEFLRERHPEATPKNLRGVEAQIRGWIGALEAGGG